MRALGGFFLLLMWLALATGLAILVYGAWSIATGPQSVSASLRSVPIGAFAMFGFAWLPPALALWAYDGTRAGAQSALFYLLALIATVAVSFVVVLVMAVNSILS